MIVPNNEAVSFRHEISLINRTGTESNGCKEICLNVNEHSEGTSLIGKSVRHFFRTKGFIRIFAGCFLKTKGFLPKVYEIFGSEMPSEHRVL